MEENCFNPLDSLICDYIRGDIEFDEIFEFCLELEPNERNKAMLIECIMYYDIQEIYDTLLGKFGHLLTAREKREYRRRYKKVFG